MRWQAFMVGLGWFSGGEPRVLLLEGEEVSLLARLRAFLVANRVDEIRYCATREFDEMILRGRFTNARRAHLASPGWEPNLNELPVRWRNIRKLLPATPPAPRGDWDCASRDVPALWAAGDRERVRAHCREDVLEMLRGISAR
jgi:hypothetical protein